MTNEGWIFVACVVTGFLTGIPYEAFSLLRKLACAACKRTWASVPFDLLFFVFCAVVVTLVAFWLHFPSFRGYTWLGYALGGIIYLKTLHRILAFFENVCYNKFTKLIKKAKKREKTLKEEGETV